MKVDSKLISDLAKLAKLRFDEKSSLSMQKDFKKILAFVDKLSEINTKNVEPLKYLSEEQDVLRDDKKIENLSQEDALKNVPKKDSDYILVPKVINK
jgi:aspartyl-tRNA(Asn)/glutamyl-tRNA(Gln) amidotransferase subunit C